MARGVVQLTHASRSRCHGPIHAVPGSPSNARDARRPGALSNRPDDAKRPPPVPASRSSAGSGASGETVTQPSAANSRAAGGAIRRAICRSASPRSRTKRDWRGALSDSRRNGVAPVVRCRT